MATLDRDAVLAAIPRNWLDPILTGDKAVVSCDADGVESDIERVLNAVRARIEALPVTETT
jgi:hypothetical protein